MGLGECQINPPPPFPPLEHVSLACSAETGVLTRAELEWRGSRAGLDSGE